MLTLAAKRTVQNLVCASSSVDIAQNDYLKKFGLRALIDDFIDQAILLSLVC
jgi:hypothetical protein